MNNKYSRREFLSRVGLSGIAMGVGSRSLFADEKPGKTEDSAGQVLTDDKSKGATLRSGKVVQPERELPVKYSTDVLVIGGGPAGVAAAVTAKRNGADVVLIERYGCFGGLFTAGLVLNLNGTFSTLKNGEKIQVAKGFNDEVIKGLVALGSDGVLEEPLIDPTPDPEATKYLLSEMVRTSGMKILLHCWGVDAIMDGNKIKGAVFESKSGRQAILAKIVIDTTGDGDIFAAAGAEYAKYIKHIGMNHRQGNFSASDKHGKIRGAGTPINGVRWINMRGEKGDGISIDDLTKLELEYRKTIWESVQKKKKEKGFENLFVLDTATQIGVRTTRLLRGVTHLKFSESLDPNNFKDIIGVGSQLDTSKYQVHIPYGSLVPKSVDGLLTAGRCVSMEFRLVDTVRLIPVCFTTGQAAGTAAAIAIKDNCEPRNVDTGKLQKNLKEQGAYLG